MADDSEKIQIGIRLPATLVQQIDAKRRKKTRAEFCRQLIEAGLTAVEHEPNAVIDNLSQMLEAFHQEFCEARQSATLAERKSDTSLAEIKRLRADLATAIVGVLTKIGQVVREEDQRPFAREKAETFVNRVLFTRRPQREEGS